MKRIFVSTVLIIICFSVPAANVRNTISIETFTRLDQEGRTSILLEDFFSARISERITLLGRGIYHIRESADTVGGGLGTVVVLGGGAYSELMYTLLHYGNNDITHRLYGDITFESVSSLTNFSTTRFISPDSWSMLLSASYRRFLQGGLHLQGRYLIGYAPSTDELITHTGVLQAGYPFKDYQFSFGGSAGTSAEDSVVEFGWSLFASAGWDISDRLHISYGITYEKKEPSMVLANRMLLSTRW